MAAGFPPGGGTDNAGIIGPAARRDSLPLVWYLHEELGVALHRRRLCGQPWAAATRQWGGW